jgi:hypothetical protein
MRRWVAVLAAVGSAMTFATAGPAAAQTPYCGIRWGSLPERAASTQASPLTDVRAGRHACFDRLVLDLRGEPVGYRVRYVAAVYEEGSGREVPLRGGARLEVVVSAPAYDDNGCATYVPADRREIVDVDGYRTFRQLAWAGSFEGQTTIGLGVRARLPLRVFTLDGPGAGSRMVIDVAHHW